MSRHAYLSIDGTMRDCVHSAGEDPLTATWDSGNFDTHPTWMDPMFWDVVAERVRELDAAVAYARVLKERKRDADRAVGNGVVA